MMVCLITSQPITTHKLAWTQKRIRSLCGGYPQRYAKQT